MKILILEDSEEKLTRVLEIVGAMAVNVVIDRAGNFNDFLIFLHKTKYDLIIADLIVPRSKGEINAVDMTEGIIESSRSFDCINFPTPMVALTRYSSKAEEKFKDLNLKDIFVITFDNGDSRWEVALQTKLASCIPPRKYDFLIICALPKEVDGFRDAGFQLGDEFAIRNLICREINIGGRTGVIITSPRMGLVSAAITSTQAIELFDPAIVCMSGICAGVLGRSKIYDVVIPEICHQNDSGKWTKEGFILEAYSVQLEHPVRQKISQIIGRSGFYESIENDIRLKATEFPEGSEDLEFEVMLAPASSGSAVIANEAAAKEITVQHRKLAAFEMESFALFEAARLSPAQPLYFSAKAVVDDGGSNKGDRFHRVACILSARVVHECLSRGLFDLVKDK